MIPRLGAFNVGRATASGGTAFVKLIPPFGGVNHQLAINKQITSGDPNQFNGGYTHVTKVVYETGGTAHQIGIMRPFNYAVVDGDVAKNATVVNLVDDPGVYSTNLKYSNPAGLSARVADNAIAASDYIAVQLTDGTWLVDTVASVSSLAITLTTGTPNVTGGGINDGALFYFFGVIANSDPNTGDVNPQVTVPASKTPDDPGGTFWRDDAGDGIVHALHEGDPLLFYSPNGTNAGVLHSISGYYGKF